MFQKYNGIHEQINSFHKEKNVQNINKFRDGLKLKSFKSFFNVLIFGIILAFFLYIIEFTTVCKLRFRKISKKLLSKIT